MNPLAKAPHLPGHRSGQPPWTAAGTGRDPRLPDAVGDRPPAAPRPGGPTIHRGQSAVAGDPAASDGVEAILAQLEHAARGTWTSLPAADAAAAADAGLLAAAIAADQHAHHSADNTAHDAPDERRHPIRCADQPASGTDRATDRPASPAAETAAAVGAAAAALQRHGLPPGMAMPVDWAGFGVVIPVLGASPGVGASVAATVLADVAQLAGLSVLLVDPADPARSGLTQAARLQGPWHTRPHPTVRIRYSWRAQAVLARLDTSLPVLAPGMVPPPRFWRPLVSTVESSVESSVEAAAFDVTVVDVGHDPWRVAANPVLGAGAWLRPGTPMPRPLLVVRPARPSLLHAEQLLARLETWAGVGVATVPAQLVVSSARRWPPGVAGAAGRRVTALVDDAVFVPHDPQLATGGIGADVMPPRLRRGMAALVRRWDMTGHPTSPRVERGRTQ